MNSDRNLNHRLFWSLATIGATLDLSTKWFAFWWVGEPPPHGPVSSVQILGDVFSFTTSYNTGALWGLGQDLPYGSELFAALSILAALAVIYWMHFGGAARDRLLSGSLGLILAGTIGNCYDRIFEAGVRDFLDVRIYKPGGELLINWPIFNLADCCLVCGAFLLMIQAFFAELPQPETAQGASGVVRATEAKQ